MEVHSGDSRSPNHLPPARKRGNALSLCINIPCEEVYNHPIYLWESGEGLSRRQRFLQRPGHWKIIPYILLATAVFTLDVIRPANYMEYGVAAGLIAPLLFYILEKIHFVNKVQRARESGFFQEFNLAGHRPLATLAAIDRLQCGYSAGQAAIIPFIPWLLLYLPPIPFLIPSLRLGVLASLVLLIFEIGLDNGKQRQMKLKRPYDIEVTRIGWLLLGRSSREQWVHFLAPALPALILWGLLQARIVMIAFPLAAGIYWANHWFRMFCNRRLARLSAAQFEFFAERWICGDLPDDILASLSDSQMEPKNSGKAKRSENPSEFVKFLRHFRQNNAAVQEKEIANHDEK